MEIHQLKYFLAAAEAGSISKAALRCKVAQPSLSQQIKKLEDNLGCTLFDRQGRGIILTEAGIIFLARAKKIINEVKETEAIFKGNLEGLAAKLSIGAIATIAPYVLPPAVSAFKKAHKDYALTINENFTENIIEKLIDNEIDLAIVSTPINSELLEVEVLANDEFLVVIPDSHPEAASKEINTSQLRDEPLVILEDLHCLGQQIESFCSSRHIAPQIVCKTTQLATIFKLVALGVGISIVPEMAAADQGKNGCRYLRIKQNKPFRQIAVAWRKDRSRSKAALDFVNNIKTQLKRGLHTL